jgi:hypothetical protein
MATGRGKNLAYLKVGSNTMTFTKGDLTISNQRNEIDVKDDSSDYNQTIPGDNKITISGSVNYQVGFATADPATADLLDSLDNGTLKQFEWAFETATGQNKYTAQGYCTSFEVAKADPQTVSFSITIAEKPTITAQA